MEKQIPEFPGYLASSEGFIVSLKRNRPKVLLGYMEPDGYHSVCLRRNGATVKRNVHRLIAATFFDLCDGDGFVNHKDGNKHNNDLENLEVVSASENMRHAVAFGLWKAPTPEHKLRIKVLAGQAKALFTKEQATSIANRPESNVALAKEFGCSKHTIRRIRIGKTTVFKEST